MIIIHNNVNISISTWSKFSSSFLISQAWSKFCYYIQKDRAGEGDVRELVMCGPGSAWKPRLGLGFWEPGLAKSQAQALSLEPPGAQGLGSAWAQAAASVLKTTPVLIVLQETKW